MAGERSARSASARSRAGTSSRKSTWRRQAETESRSSSGSFIPSSQRRPRRPKRSLGRRGQRLRARADLFFARRAGAQQPLPAVDEPAQRPCLLVRAPHLLEEIRGEQPGQGAGVASIGLGLGAETNWSLRVLAPPRKRRPARSSARYTSRRSSDSSAWSSAPRLGAHSSSACGLVSTVPAERYLAALGDRTSQWSRWMSTPSEAHLPSSRR